MAAGGEKSVCCSETGRRAKEGSVWKICTEMDGRQPSGQEQNKTTVEKSHTISLVTPFSDIMQAPTLVDLDAAVASRLWSVIAAFARVAAG